MGFLLSVAAQEQDHVSPIFIFISKLSRAMPVEVILSLFKRHYIKDSYSLHWTFIFAIAKAASKHIHRDYLLTFTGPQVFQVLSTTSSSTQIHLLVSTDEKNDTLHCSEIKQLYLKAYQKNDNTVSPWNDSQGVLVDVLASADEIWMLSKLFSLDFDPRFSRTTSSSLLEVWTREDDEVSP